MIAGFSSGKGPFKKMIGTKVIDSPVGAGTITGYTDVGYPQVDYVAVTWYMLEDRFIVGDYKAAGEMMALRMFQINKYWESYVDDPNWKKMISLVGRQLTLKNLSQEELFEVGNLASLFNCLTNDQIEEFIKEYPDYEQRLEKYW
jgi:hypothetical protein